MLLLGSDRLSQFINVAAETPFEWGKWDCLLWLAEWVRANKGIDPAHGLWGKYDSMLGAARIVKQAGGMARLVERQVRPHGIQRVTDPKRGDIAVVRMPGAGGEHFGSMAGSVLLDGTAALFCQGGVLFTALTDAPPVAIWRI